MSRRLYRRPAKVETRPFWTECPELRETPVDAAKFPGKRYGALTVIGLLAGRQGWWAVRCLCGRFECYRLATLNTGQFLACQFCTAEGRSPQPQKRWFEILWRQQDGKCFYCYWPMLRPECVPADTQPGKMATRDHKVPRSRGGRGSPQNYALACATCNRRKGNLTPEEFERQFSRYLAKVRAMPPQAGQGRIDTAPAVASAMLPPSSPEPPPSPLQSTP